MNEQTDSFEQHPTLDYYVPQAPEKSRSVLGFVSLILALASLCLLATSVVSEAKFSILSSNRGLYLASIGLLNGIAWLCGFIAGHMEDKLDRSAFCGWLLSTFNVLVLLGLLNY